MMKCGHRESSSYTTCADCERALSATVSAQLVKTDARVAELEAETRTLRNVGVTQAERLEALEAALVDLRGAAETASVRLPESDWRYLCSAIERANKAIGPRKVTPSVGEDRLLSTAERIADLVSDNMPVEVTDRVRKRIFDILNEPSPETPSPLEAVRAELDVDEVKGVGASEERARIVAFLRHEVDMSGYVPRQSALKRAADDIEQGEHLGPMATGSTGS